MFPSQVVRPESRCATRIESDFKALQIAFQRDPSLTDPALCRRAAAPQLHHMTSAELLEPRARLFSCAADGSIFL